VATQAEFLEYHESPTDRTIKKLLLKLGEADCFSPLHKVITPAGAICWVCPEHFQAFYSQITGGDGTETLVASPTGSLDVLSQPPQIERPPKATVTPESSIVSRMTVAAPLDETTNIPTPRSHITPPTNDVEGRFLRYPYSLEAELYDSVAAIIGLGRTGGKVPTLDDVLNAAKDEELEIPRVAFADGRRFVTHDTVNAFDHIKKTLELLYDHFYSSINDSRLVRPLLSPVLIRPHPSADHAGDAFVRPDGSFAKLEVHSPHTIADVFARDVIRDLLKQAHAIIGGNRPRLEFDVEWLDDELTHDDYDDYEGEQRDLRCKRMHCAAFGALMVLDRTVRVMVSYGWKANELTLSDLEQFSIVIAVPRQLDCYSYPDVGMSGWVRISQILDILVSEAQRDVSAGFKTIQGLRLYVAPSEHAAAIKQLMEEALERRSQSVENVRFWIDWIW
jgi:hypothetical protein